MGHIIFCFLLMKLFSGQVNKLHAVKGMTYNVGDSKGWTTGINYRQWSSSKIFHLGDIIVFKYDPCDHDVLQVTKEDFFTCTISNPISTYKSGNDAVILKGGYEFYFICGGANHCQEGHQKLQIRVGSVSAILSSLSETLGITQWIPSVILFVYLF